MVDLKAMSSRSGRAIATFLNFYASHGITRQRCFKRRRKVLYLFCR